VGLLADAAAAARVAAGPCYRARMGIQGMARTAALVLATAIGCGGNSEPAPQAPATQPASAAEPAPAGEQAQPQPELPPPTATSEQSEKVLACTQTCVDGRQQEAKAADAITAECATQCKDACVQECTQARAAEATAPEIIAQGCADSCQS